MMENIGCYARILPGREEAVMIFSHEQALLKAQADLEDLAAFAALCRPRRCWTDAALRNLYGPAETNVCTAHRIPDHALKPNGIRSPAATCSVRRPR